MAELILILGGTRSGKSTLAEHMAHERGGDDVLFVATAQAFDDEMRERITAHQLSRPSAWRTLEAPLQLATALQTAPLANTVVVDCITLLAACRREGIISPKLRHNSPFLVPSVVSGSHQAQEFHVLIVSWPVRCAGA
ncbi:MAG: bifunctional adenosylcobinamide kinase/adenosylcobinamide-phosphate guanylyltransferase [Chloroflexi bacterium]|nr:bifunctional adenosylcobinamide kinase/adenosylcobinamide-phosphate guanylyltransferase [Chloroflexota bacterium]